MSHTAATQESEQPKKPGHHIFHRLMRGDGQLAQIVRFGMVGGMVTLIQYGVYVVFVGPVGVPAVLSTMISYAISFIFNFFLSNYFTFHSRPNALRGIGFTLSHLINMGLQVGMVAIFQQIMSKELALLPAMAVCIPLNYLLVRFALTSAFMDRLSQRLADLRKK